MDKKVQRQIRSAARKSAKQLKTCSDHEFNEFMEYLTKKELAVGCDISNTTKEIRELESRPRTRGVSQMGKLETVAVSTVTTAAVAAIMSMLGEADTATTIVSSGISAVVGMGIGNAISTVYDKKPLSNAVNDIILNSKRKKLDKLQQDREESDYYLTVLDEELARE